jgi:transposase
MLSVSPSTPIYVATEPADMRRSFDGLSGMVQSVMQLEPCSGALFVFRNKRGTQLKILYWVGDGWAIWHRRLEQGTFRSLQASDGQASLSISAAELAMLLEGLDASEVHRRKRYQKIA